MRRDRSLHRNGRTLARSCFISALALVAIVNIIYVWPGKLGGSSGSSATPTAHPGAYDRSAPERLQSRKQLKATKALSVDPMAPLIVTLRCADQAPDCQKQ